MSQREMSRCDLNWHLVQAKVARTPTWPLPLDATPPLQKKGENYRSAARFLEDFVPPYFVLTGLQETELVRQSEAADGRRRMYPIALHIFNRYCMNIRQSHSQ